MSQNEQFLDLPLEEVVGDRFGRYSKYIIQDRALPDVRDGLKPVQRRILYAMHQDKNTFEKNFRKAAKTVGTVIGNYHPHGDISVYDAMVRMSQDWKMRNKLVEMHGNNGSIDGDPPAAMRYTEARLSSISSELLRDIDKNTVEFIPNFDDTDEEPLVLPAKFPNLLINGSTGISAGYATDIPPHNLNEVIDAVIMRIDKPTASVDDLMKAIKGPDFPTGGIAQGIDGLKEAYETGKGKVILRGNAKIEKMRGGREQIVIDEIPYDVNKANLVKRMDELRIDRTVEGISEVRDETDRTGLRIIIELRKEANAEGILHFLYKNTDLQVTYHFNMVGIEDKTPKLLSLPMIIDAYITHQKQVLKNSTTFDLEKATARAHIVDGLIKAISILDELLATIRASKNKSEAKQAIMKQFGFTEPQAEAIVMLQLYRLTNTDVTALQKEAKELAIQIDEMNALLSSDKKLEQAIKKELRTMKKQYHSERRTQIEAEIEELKINIDVTVVSEEVVVSITKDGYIKRTSIRSYAASNGEDIGLKDEDHVLTLLELNTTDQVLIFTNRGNFIKLPVHALPEIRWKDMGQHISNIASLNQNEQIVQAIPVREFTKDHFLVFLTKNGMIKRSELNLYNAQRYTRFLIAMNLKKDDELLQVMLTDGNQDVFMATNTGYGLWFEESEAGIVGLRAAGVKGIQLKENEFVVNGDAFTDSEKPDVYIVTQRGFHKKVKLTNFKKSTRAKRGQKMLKDLKTNPHYVKYHTLVKEMDDIVMVEMDNGESLEVHPATLSVSELTSNGKKLFKEGAPTVQDAHSLAQYLAPFQNKA
ncbi:MAG TPA: DNA topoisomerase IV subunit A [Candidatus Avamphibacillus intestinigallinarum]|nr:DNA topoisomerase IV subunit A [Candidatus Avamphibacillus intestinigallinarum]